MMMNSVSRNPSVRLGRKAEEHQNNKEGAETINLLGSNGWRVFSARRSNHQNMMRSSFSYRRHHTRKRQIFLQTYKLGSEQTSKSVTPKLEAIGLKVKSAVVSFMRGGAFRSCDSRKSVQVVSPSRVATFC